MAKAIAGEHKRGKRNGACTLVSRRKEATETKNPRSRTPGSGDHFQISDLRAAHGQ